MIPNSAVLAHKLEHLEKITVLYLLLLNAGGSLERWLWGCKCYNKKEVFFRQVKKNMFFCIHFVNFFVYTYVTWAPPWFWLLLLDSLQSSQFSDILPLLYCLLSKRDKSYLNWKKQNTITLKSKTVRYLWKCLLLHFFLLRPDYVSWVWWCWRLPGRSVHLKNIDSTDIFNHFKVIWADISILNLNSKIQLKKKVNAKS